MTREEIEAILLRVLEQKFKIKDPDRDQSLTEHYDFDSIDAVEMMEELEANHGMRLSQDQKKQLFDHRTIHQLALFLAAALRE